MQEADFRTADSKKQPQGQVGTRAHRRISKVVYVDDTQDDEESKADMYEDVEAFDATPDPYDNAAYYGVPTLQKLQPAKMKKAAPAGHQAKKSMGQRLAIL